VVKNTSELCVGILTSCIKEETVLKRLGRNNATVKNILIKLNAKLNGKSHEIEETSFKAISDNAGVMFVGADVTHPSPDQRSIPSVVGVVSSYDQVGTKYIPTWRLQEPRVEMIQDLENILVEHLRAYGNFNKKLPKRIMYYRDGVADSQFNQVLDVEMTAIRKAMHRIYGQNNKPAEVTFVVVQKRHHTRFFPTDPKFADRNGNILAGTVVDKDIVHPFQYQFFMASHASILGVTKPSKYCILANESKISADDIQAITFDLCHLFSRCNRSVSYPAPTYYAHLAAARGKNYFDENDIASIMENIDLANQKYQNNGINQTFVRESPMFFV
jgi:eukaryotic translation initiation factor 2C